MRWTSLLSGVQWGYDGQPSETELFIYGWPTTIGSELSWRATWLLIVLPRRKHRQHALSGFLDHRKRGDERQSNLSGWFCPADQPYCRACPLGGPFEYDSHGHSYYHAISLTSGSAKGPIPGISKFTPLQRAGFTYRILPNRVQPGRAASKVRRVPLLGRIWYLLSLRMRTYPLFYCGVLVVPVS